MTSALLVSDLQTDVMSGCPSADEVLATVNALASKARAAGSPVVLVRQQDENLVPGQDGWRLAPRLLQAPSDHVVDKRFRDAFAATGLTDMLRRLGVRLVVVCGAHSDYCVQTTALSALAQGFDLALVADGHAAEAAIVGDSRIEADVVSGFVNARMRTLRYPGRRIIVPTAAQLDFG